MLSWSSLLIELRAGCQTIEKMLKTVVFLWTFSTIGLSDRGFQHVELKHGMHILKRREARLRQPGKAGLRPGQAGPGHRQVTSAPPTVPGRPNEQLSALRARLIFILFRCSWVDGTIHSFRLYTAHRQRHLRLGTSNMSMSMYFVVC